MKLFNKKLGIRGVFWLCAGRRFNERRSSTTDYIPASLTDTNLTAWCGRRVRGEASGMNKQSRRDVKVFGEFGDVFHGEVALAIEQADAEAAIYVQ